MTDLKPIADEAATRLTFSLMRSAYLDLAQHLIRIDAEPARELLQAVEHRIAYRLGSLMKDLPEDATEGTALTVAAGQVRSVLREASESA